MGKPTEQRVYLTFSGTIRQIVRDEGVFALWRPGLTSTCTRDLAYSGIRVGLYPLMKRVIAGDDGETDIGVARKLMVGMVTGALGSAIANPTDLVKIWAPEFGGRNGFPPPEKNALVLSIKMGCADSVPVQSKPHTPF